MIMAFLKDPRLFNLIILSLSFLSACRWGFERSWIHCLYWAFATGLTATVTFGYRQ